jgi:hypothetical protein
MMVDDENEECPVVRRFDREFSDAIWTMRRHGWNEISSCLLRVRSTLRPALGGSSRTDESNLPTGKSVVTATELETRSNEP